MKSERSDVRTPGTDRYLACGLSKSVCVNTRKNLEIMPEPGYVRRHSGGGCSKVAKDQSSEISLFFGKGE